MNGFYPEKLTSLSLKELEKFSEWSKKLDFVPVIVGGWAVYGYCKHSGSIDIDVVLKHKDFKKAGEYLEKNGYEKRPLDTYAKKFTLEGGTFDEIIFEFLDFNDKNELEDENVGIPLSLVEKNSAEVKMNGFTAKLASIELLLLLKIKGLLSRTAQRLRFEFGIPRWKKERMNKKIQKDILDIREIVKQPRDEKKINELLEKTKFKKQYDYAMNYYYFKKVSAIITKVDVK